MSDTKKGTREQFGFVGTGNMGKPMAVNLAKWLHENGLPPLQVYNRTQSKLPPQDDTLKHAKALKDMAHDCDIVITSLASDEAAEAVFAQLLDGARAKEPKGEGFKEGKQGKSTIFVDTSTIFPELSGRLEREAAKIPGVFYLACPVFGPPPMAETAKLVFVVSGDYWAKKHVCQFLVPSMGRKFLDVGSNVERAAAFKLNGNFLILSILESLSEAMTLADKTGVGASLLMEFVKEFLPAPSFIGYGTKILNNSFDGDSGFTVTGGLKDASHIRRLAASVDATVPIIDLAHKHLITSRAHGGESLDWSSLVAGPRLAAGLQPFSGLKAAPQDTGFGAKSVEHGDEITKPIKSGDLKTVQNFKE